MVELVFDLVDLHALPPKVEELVCAEISCVVVSERGDLGRERTRYVGLISKDAKLWVLNLSRKLKNLWYESGHKEYKRTCLVLHPDNSQMGL